MPEAKILWFNIFQFIVKISCAYDPLFTEMLSSLLKIIYEEKINLQKILPKY